MLPRNFYPPVTALQPFPTPRNPQIIIAIRHMVITAYAPRTGTDAFPSKVWSALRIETHADTPKGKVRRRVVLAPDQLANNCIPTGEPMHCILNARKLVHPFANDARHFKADYAETIDALSLKDRPAFDAPTPPPVLSDGAVALLESFVADSTAEFAAACAKDCAGTQALKAFTAHSGVRESDVWMQRFRAVPPRGVLGRLAYRLGVELHPANCRHGWKSAKAFRDAVSALEKWYAPGRRKSTWRRGIMRSPNAPERVKGRKTLMTSKLRTHLKNLRNSRKVEGLWAWRIVARGLLKAGIPVHTGTVPVERLWSALLSFYPGASRRMSMEWWLLLMKVCYMRYNYRHFNHATLPSWSEGDVLLSERMDALVSITRALHASAHGDNATISALQHAFD